MVGANQRQDQVQAPIQANGQVGSKTSSGKVYTTEEPKKSKKWLWWIITILVLLIISGVVWWKLSG